MIKFNDYRNEDFIIREILRLRKNNSNRISHSNRSDDSVICKKQKTVIPEKKKFKDIFVQLDLFPALRILVSIPTFVEMLTEI